MNKIALLLLCLALTVVVLSTQIATPTPDKYALIVNTSDDFAYANAYHVDSFPAQSLQAYWTLKDLGYADDRIVFMLYHVNDDFIDVDGDGDDDLSGAVIDVENEDVTRDRLRDAMQSLAAVIKPNDELLVYLVDHGAHHNTTSASLVFEVGPSLTEEDFAGWLNEIPCEAMVVLLDFCYSGNFASSLIEPGRTTIVAAADNHEAWYYWEAGPGLSETNRELFGNAGSIFFHPFWKRLREGGTLEEAFEYGKKQMVRWAIIDPQHSYTVERQTPQLFASAEAATSGHRYTLSLVAGTVSVALLVTVILFRSRTNRMR